jgi:hypothetical protein
MGKCFLAVFSQNSEGQVKPINFAGQTFIVKLLRVDLNVLPLKAKGNAQHVIVPQFL